MKRSKRAWWIPLSAALAACQGVGDDIGEPTATSGQLDEHMETEVVHTEVAPPPVSGGSLLLIDEGRTAVAADSDRDVVYVVDLDYRGLVHTIALREGDEPGRLTADDAGRVHVIMRGSGVVAMIDPEAGRVVRRTVACKNPRGIAYESATEQLHVACAGGDLVSMPSHGGEVTRRVTVAPDLRDVWVTPQGLAVSRFRAAEVLYLDEDGMTTDVHGLPRMSDGGLSGNLRASVAWRTRPTPSGEWLMLHQLAPTQALTITPPEERPGDEGGYGGSGDTRDNCGAVVNPSITLGSSDYSARTSGPLSTMVLPVDVAISDSGKRLAIAVAGNEHDTDDNGVFTLDTEALSLHLAAGCQDPTPLPVGPGQYTSVAFDPQGRVVAFSREPAKLVRIDPWQTHARLVVDLHEAARLDTGHDLFHRDAGRGISCASCHPEGGDDGHVWSFFGIGERHTPSLAVGLAGTEPFHWEGDLADMTVLMDEVHGRRMGGKPQAPERIEALSSWLFTMPMPRPPRATLTAQVQRGAAAFAGLGCTSCHQGPAMDGGATMVRIKGLDLQVPPLRGVALHPPYMHDGRAATLTEAVFDMVQRTSAEAGIVTDEQVADVVAYLESL